MHLSWPPSGSHADGGGAGGLAFVPQQGLQLLDGTAAQLVYPVQVASQQGLQPLDGTAAETVLFDPLVAQQMLSGPAVAGLLFHAVPCPSTSTYQVADTHLYHMYHSTTTTPDHWLIQMRAQEKLQAALEAETTEAMPTDDVPPRTGRP